MDNKEKAKIIDNFIKGLLSNRNCTIPEIILGFQNYPELNSDIDFQFRVIEQDLVNMQLAKKVGGGDNSTINGYIIFQLLPKAYELLVSKTSVLELLESIDDEKNIESKSKILSYEKLEHEKSIRPQEQRIRNLNEQNSVGSLVQKYWWFLLSLLGLSKVH